MMTMTAAVFGSGSVCRCRCGEIATNIGGEPTTSPATCIDCFREGRYMDVTVVR